MSRTTTTARTTFNTMAGITLTVLSLAPATRAEEAHEVANVESTSTANSSLLDLPTPTAATLRLPVAPVRLAPGSIVSQGRDLHRWKLSLVPLAASQALDLSSSWGMRELNPVLAGQDGRFGAQAATVKLGAVGALVGIEYLIVKKYPRTARAFEKINWSGAALTSGFAVHNFMIK